MADIVETLIPAGGGDYTLMSVAEATAQGQYGDLVADGNTYNLECYAGTIDDTPSWDGWVTGENNNVTIKAAAGEGHDGVEGAGFVITNTINSAFPTMRMLLPWTVIQGIEIEKPSDDSALNLYSSATSCLVNGCIIRNTAESTSYCFNIGANQTTARNCLIKSASRGTDIRSESDVVIDNCTYIGLGSPGYGLLTDNLNTVRNTVSYGYSTACFLGPSGTDSNLASSDGTASSAAASQVNIPESSFVDYLGGDYSPAPAPELLAETGADLSTDFTTDITGATRTVPWTIGAYIVAGGPPPVGVQEMYIKDGGIFVKYTPHVKVGGTFQEVDAYVLDGGTWVPVHEK